MVTINAPALGLTYFPGLALDSVNSGVWTLQATAASQTYAPPSGFVAWDSAAPTHSPQALAYLARTVGGNEGGNGANIATLIDGLVSDGVWAKLDALYVLAQQNATDARLNLISASYPLTGTATFTTYQGFSAFPTSGLDTGLNVTTATSPHYTQNSASFGLWSYALLSENVAQIGSGTISHIYNDYTGGNLFARINNGTVSPVGVAITKGLIGADRPDASTVYSYQNGAISVGTPIGLPSVVPDNSDFTIGAVIGPAFGSDKSAPSAQTLSAAFIGASLGAAGQLALYNRLNTYMGAAAAQAYLARTVGGNEGGNAGPITALIEGLVADGVWQKLDALYVLAQQNQSDALLNLVGTNYSITASLLAKPAPRSVTFTPYQGFSGFGSSTAGLDTGFNPTTAPSSNYTLNNASFGIWSYAVISEASAQMASSATGSHAYIFNFYGGVFYPRVNDSGAYTQPTTITKGLFVAERTNSTTVFGYQNGVGSSNSTSSDSMDNGNFTLGRNAVVGVTAQTLSAAFIGASLGAAGQLALYNRLRTYMTAVGVP